MLPLLLAAATCATGDVSTLLQAHRAAVQAPAQQATRVARYSYSGEGLQGDLVSTVDETSGAFIQEVNAGIVHTAEGFDGRRAWRRDLSGFVTPQDGGDKPALAVNEAYRAANRWWRADRDGARLESLGCDGLRVTPRGGSAFDAWFDPATHLLTRVREARSFGTVTETHYSEYRRISGRLVPGRMEVITNDDASAPLVLGLVSLEVKARASRTLFAMPRPGARDWTLPASGRTTVPFQLLNNHIIVPVRVNGGEPLPFLLDTGGHDILTPATVKALGLKVAGASAASGGGEATNTSGYVRIESLQVGEASMGPESALALDFSPPDVEGLTLGGMLGAGFLERFVVRIDYGARTVTFIDPARFSAKERASAGVGVPFTFYEHLPQVQGTLDGRPARFDIDTGSRSDVNVTSPFVERAALRTAYPHGVTVTEGWGAGGPSRAYVVRLGELTLGKVRVPKPLASLSSAKRGAFSDASYEGNVGSGLLKRFVATFDYARQVLYLAPLARPDADASRFDRAGIWVNQADGGVQVMDVAPGSPAEEAGLKVGDLITQLDGQPVAAQSLSDVRRSLKLLPVGVAVRIDFTRAGVPKTARLVPRDLIPD
ncbi:aspartyl protease family protein [Pyxidicoccus parkwayensis]|uniref:Aspartyl protease family protein n=1 Tax=Pyxidicoccus parkwayensis TaxID=2813578 RepID=A0ABX7NSV4_9BACT|nr:aspartyl protease family protein [Pyxidicoccus parkwaysis]QSQ21975.1 aspartyl protease family protein [Pyxidicoccus parkwaysis]